MANPKAEGAAFLSLQQPAAQEHACWLGGHKVCERGCVCVNCTGGKGGAGRAAEHPGQGSGGAAREAGPQTGTRREFPCNPRPSVFSSTGCTCVGGNSTAALHASFPQPLMTYLVFVVPDPSGTCLQPNNLLTTSSTPLCNVSSHSINDRTSLFVHRPPICHHSARSQPDPQSPPGRGRQQPPRPLPRCIRRGTAFPGWPCSCAWSRLPRASWAPGCCSALTASSPAMCKPRFGAA